MRYRQKRKWRASILTPIFYKSTYYFTRRLKQSKQMINYSKTFNNSDFHRGRFFWLYSLCDTLGLRSIQTVEIIHNSTCIHTCTLPFSNRAVLTSLRGTRRGQGSQLHNLFFASSTGRQLSGYFRKLFADNYDKQTNQTQRKTASNKNTLSHSLECSQQIIAAPWFLYQCCFPFSITEVEMSGSVWIRMKYSKYFGCCRPLRRKHL